MTSAVCIASYISPGGSHTGSSDHGSAPAASSASGAVQRSSASAPVTRTHASSSPPMVVCPGGETRLYGPESPAAIASRVHSARSRTSMYWIGESAGPGARTGPPRAIRPSHQGSRPTFSYGPMIRPARTSSVRSAPNAAVAASSPPRLDSAYGMSPSSGDPSTSGPSSASPAAGGQAYTDRLDTYAYRPTRSASSRAASRTAEGAADQVSTTASQEPAASAARPSGPVVRSPSSEVTPPAARAGPGGRRSPPSPVRARPRRPRGPRTPYLRASAVS